MMILSFALSYGRPGELTPMHAFSKKYTAILLASIFPLLLPHSPLKKSFAFSGPLLV